MKIIINRSSKEAAERERLINVLLRSGVELSNLCYHPQLGPIQTCDTADGSDQPLLYTKELAFPDGKAQLFPLVWRAPFGRVDDEFDLHLNNGRLLEHFHEGNLT